MEEMMEKMGAAIAALEFAVSQMRERELALSAQADERVERIVATVESQRETELAQRLEAAEAKLAEAESRIAALSAAATAAAETAPVMQSGRKTMAAGISMMLAKQGVSVGSLEAPESGRFEANALDSALSSLTIEQRFAVKAEMLRTGLLS